MTKASEKNEKASMSTADMTDRQIQAIPKYYSGIDWVSLLFRLLEKIHWILLAAVIGAAAAFFYVRFSVTPIYQATSKLYIAGSETSISLSDLQLGSTLAKDYQEVFKIWHIHEMVDEKLGLNYSYGKLGSMVSVSVPDGSHVLYIRIKSADPEEARQLADTYAEVVQDFIANKMELRKPQLLEKAQKPSAPISPNTKGMVMTGFAGGGFAVAALITFLFLLDDRIRTSDDIENKTNLAVLGIIPHQEEAASNKAKADVPDIPKAIPKAVPALVKSGEMTAVIHGNIRLDYSASEAINMICSSITFAGKKTRKIAVTSYEAGNGKTYVTLRVAAEMANRGKKTLLIDCDLRKSVMVSRYGIELSGNKQGIAHYLSGQCGADRIVYKTDIPNLSIIPVGRDVKTPLPLLTSDDFGKLLKSLDAEYDYILIDTPPLGMVVDAAEIAQKCDASILVVEYNQSTIRALRTMQKHLEQANSPVLGCVINKMAVRSLGKKHYYYYYGAYGYGVEEKKHNSSLFRSHLKKNREKQ